MLLKYKCFVILFLFASISAFAGPEKIRRDIVVLKAFSSELADSVEKSTNHTRTFNLLNDLLSQSSSIGYKAGEIQARILLGKFYYLRGEYTKSISEYNSSLMLSKRDESTPELGEIYRSIGEVYRSVFQREKALAYLDTAEAIFAAIGDNYGLAKVKNRQAAIKLQLNERAAAVELCKSSNSLISSLQISRPRLDDLRGNNYNILAKTFVRRPDSSYFYYYKAIESFQRARSLDLPNAYINLAAEYLQNDQADSALKYSLAAYEKSSRSGVSSYVHTAAAIAASAFYRVGDYRKAFDYLKISGDIRNRIISEKFDSKFADVQKSFENAITQAEFRGEQKKAEYLAAIAAAILLLSAITIVILRKKNALIKRKNAELSAAYKLIYIKNQDLDELNETKDKFFSLIAHDLKNPLGSIRFLSDMLRSNYAEFEDTDKQEYIEEIAKTSEQLNRLLENLLSWARSQQGKVKFNPERNDIGALINTVVMLLDSSAKKKSIGIHKACQIESPIIIDANMINTVIRNLVSNAIKFTSERGTITISARETATSDDGKAVLVSVKDTGIGMTAEETEKLFKIDKVFSKPGTNEEKGTGLGLILCKEFVERHGGRIWVESECGKGTCFKFTIPSAPGKS